jgi:hypothetical protein
MQNPNPDSAHGQSRARMREVGVLLGADLPFPLMLGIPYLEHSYSECIMGISGIEQMPCCPDLSLDIVIFFLNSAIFQGIYSSAWLLGHLRQNQQQDKH